MYSSERRAPAEVQAQSQEAAKPAVVGRQRSLSMIPSKEKVDRVLNEEVRGWLLEMVDGFRDAELKAAANVVDVLRDGLVLYVLMERIMRPAVPVASLKLPRSSGFYARDTVARFTTWAKDKFSLRTELLFTDDELCDGKNDRQVINCLLTIAGIAFRRGLAAAPAVVKFEQEIEEQSQHVDERVLDVAIAEDEACRECDGEADLEDLEQAVAAEEAEARSTLCAAEESERKTLAALCTAPPDAVGESKISTNDDRPAEAPLSSSPRRYVARKGDQVDKEVSKTVNALLQKTGAVHTRIRRLKNQGEYVVYHRITGKRTVVYVRVVQKNLMIRVGGGWDVFEDWLRRHVVDVECLPAGTMQKRVQQEALARHQTR